jgi:hypothetical protein
VSLTILGGIHSAYSLLSLLKQGIAILTKHPAIAFPFLLILKAWFVEYFFANFLEKFLALEYIQYNKVVERTVVEHGFFVDLVVFEVDGTPDFDEISKGWVITDEVKQKLRG